MSLSLSLVSWLLLVPAAEKKADAYPRADLLIEAEELVKQYKGGQFTKPNSTLRLLDVRPRDQFLAGHVPQAVWLDHDDWSKAFAAGQNVKEWSKRLGKFGLGKEVQVVIYDDGSVKDAARIWWILRYWGLHPVRLLNGGWPAWRAAGGEIAKGAEDIEFLRRLLPVTEADRLATKGQLLEWLKSKDGQIIDARSTAEYCGDAKMAKRNGAIPDAIHLEWSEVLDKKTRRFKSAAELARLFKDAGIDLNKPAVTYCQSGGRAAVMAFTLELMGAKHVRNYYRSWAEWGNAEDTPVIKGKRK
jgi:thiosulfate/3-mercaptopyruvate sulfurtransferase